MALLFAVPFVFCGLILGGLLSAKEFSAPRVYFYDLAGSAAGALLVIPAISRFGVESCLLGACALMLVGALLLALPEAKLTRLMVSIAATLLAIAAYRPAHFFDFHYAPGSILAVSQIPDSGFRLERTIWDPLARIEMTRIPPPDPLTMNFPALIGKDRAFLASFERVVTQNNFAFTYAVHYNGTPSTLKGIDQTIYSAAYHTLANPPPRVLIIGVGGGFDVLNALYHGAPHITGVEVNAATLTLLRDSERDYFYSWVEDPHVQLVHAEGRNYLSRSTSVYDLIALSGVDSYSGTPGAANVFSENYLYTQEAFDLYYSRLAPRGILAMMRLEFHPPREMLKALATAVARLRGSGVQHPFQHIIMLTQNNGSFTALLVKKTPFTISEERRLKAWARRSPFFYVSASPDSDSQRRNLYERFLAFDDPAAEVWFIRNYPFDIAPAEDDRPFFFRHSFWRHLFTHSALIQSTVPVMEYSVLLLTMCVGAAALVCILVPLCFLSSRVRRGGRTWRYAILFAVTGVGYMALEIGLMQKYGLLLGHPNYALSVVLAALLFTTGLGSLVSDRWVQLFGRLRFISYLLSGVIFLEYAVVFPQIVSWIRLPFWIRITMVCGLITPIGLCLGVFVPSALERLKVEAPDYVPWAWGINGVCSVLGPIISVAFSMTFGINALLISAIPLYLLAGAAFPSVRKISGH